MIRAWAPSQWSLRMQYVRQVTDLDTGAKRWIDLGDHRPLTEVAKSLSVGPLKFRQALLHMGLLQREWDERAGEHRRRLTPGAVQSGFGIRHDNLGFHYDPERVPFDVLSPSGVDYIREHLPECLAALSQLTGEVTKALEELAAWDRRRLAPMEADQKVAWLEDHFPGLSAAAVAGGLGVSEVLVHRYRRRRQGQRRELMAWANRDLNNSPHPTVFTTNDAQGVGV